jgi:glucose-1-phosphate thymidylyltransferase
VRYIRQEKQLGSGHALLQAESAVENRTIVVNGDRLIEADAVSAVAETFERDTADAAVAVVERDDAGEYGAVRLEDRDIVELVEKPRTGNYRLINAGIYAFDRSIFERIENTPREAGELALPETISRMLEAKRVRGVRTDGLWVDATYPWDLLEMATEVLVRGRIAERKRQTGLWVHGDALVSDDAALRPPAVVSADSEIGPGSVVGPNVALGQNGTVGANATIERAVLGTDSRVGHGATVVDAVLGQHATLGVDTTIPGGPADVRVGHEVFESQRLGAVLGDRVESGGAASFAPGTLVGTDASIGPNAHVSGHVPDDAEVVR